MGDAAETEAPLVETLVIEDGHAVAEHFRALGPNRTAVRAVCGEATCSVKARWTTSESKRAASAQQGKRSKESAGR
jgi:hypothetical protein